MDSLYAHALKFFTDRFGQPPADRLPSDLPMKGVDIDMNAALLTSAEDAHAQCAVVWGILNQAVAYDRCGISMWHPPAWGLREVDGRIVVEVITEPDAFKMAEAFARMPAPEDVHPFADRAPQNPKSGAEIMARLRADEPSSIHNWRNDAEPVVSGDPAALDLAPMADRLRERLAGRTQLQCHPVEGYATKPDGVLVYFDLSEDMFRPITQEWVDRTQAMLSAYARAVNQMRRVLRDLDVNRKHIDAETKPS